MTQFGLVPAANNRRPSAGPNRSRRPQQTQFQSQLKPQQSSSSSSSFQNQLDPFALHETRHEIDTKMGFARYKEGPGRLGWLVNLQETLVEDPEWETGRAAVDFYFIQETGETFKSTIVESPYFLIACKKNKEPDVEEYLRRKFEKTIEKIVRVQKEDLDLANHLLGYKRTYLQLSFRNTRDLMDIRRMLMPAVKKNQASLEAEEAYSNLAALYGREDDDNMNDEQGREGAQVKNFKDGLDYIIDIREYDVPYLSRIAIDFDYRVGLWYNVMEKDGLIQIKRQYDRVLPADPVILAFDIETTKAPLKFPDSDIDQIMMISYMVNGQGYLITNREIVSEDIEDFDYSPKPGEYDGPFIIFNEADEKALIECFFNHIRELKPSVFVTYNGDFFDWPFVETRAKTYDLDMFKEIGFAKNDQDEYWSTYASHMDCFRWVKRDSYLPVGSQGLKAVTKYKLGYDPKELDPELMTRYAAEHPHILADYSVSDAVSTYYLYMKYVHPFVFSLCNIIPLAPDDVLRKGSGTLCELLLMVQAYKANVIMPNKHVEEKGKFFEGHLLESETYVGGHVEALESGVFRSDIPTLFRLVPAAFDRLLNDLDRALKFSIEVEEKKKLEDVVNYEEVREEIAAALRNLRDIPNRKEKPLIYHLDVAAMYPNIILTNRLQPPALISEEVCAACDFNRPDANCKRRMNWSWRGEFFPADRSEYNMIKNQLESEKFPPKNNGEPRRSWAQLTPGEQNTMITKRLNDYSKKVYKKIHDNKVEDRESIVCQRENSFYVDTVRSFRDRRYEYKGKLKTWKKALDSATNEEDPAKIDECKKMIVLMDSLQLAHKCILNSFYGYVMRKGSRWYSMEMAGIVCLTGANIITMAREIVEQIGRPLELDTDGIWCILPKTFPENFRFQLRNGGQLTISYPCVMLNHLVHDKFTNHQYQDLVDPDTHLYESRSENSIFFEVDGPYRAMILPASKEENKLLKKRYAVFDENGKLAELKGFEVKRRGELKMIKIFQEEVFTSFLEGQSLDDCYAAVAKIANRWLDILYTKGESTSDEELLEYISENRSMSKTLDEYGSQKSTSISTAKRLAEFLGDQMVKDKGLACKFIIALKPVDAPVAERAIPVAIFSAEQSVMKHFLRKWLKDSSLVNFDIRSILDWQYYIERLGSAIQKVITIPAAMQGVSNPVPRIQHPDWLLKQTDSKAVGYLKQNLITDMFSSKVKGPNDHPGTKPDSQSSNLLDIEDNMGDKTAIVKRMQGAVIKTKFSSKSKKQDEEEEVLPDKMPDVNTDYFGWLRYQKIKWKQQRKRRKLLKAGDLSVLDNPTSGGFFQRQGLSILHRPWEIIQIAETELLGEFRLWILVDRHLHSVRFTVPRIFYVNCKEPETKGLYQRVGKILPRSHVSHYLYEFSIPENEYQSDGSTYKGFAWHHDTAGVYETQIPLLFRALLKMGCMALLDPHKTRQTKKRVEDGFDMTDFSTRRLPSNHYLEGDRLSYLFLYHSNADTRHIIGLFYPQQKKCRVFLIDPYRNNQMPNLQRIYQDRRNSFEQEADETELSLFPFSEELDFSITSYTNERDATRAIQKALLEYQSERNGPTCILVQSPRPIGLLTRQIRILSEFPTIPVPSNRKDNVYPALDWQRTVSRRMIQAFFFSRRWLNDRLILSRYSNVPVANIDADPALFLSDLFFSRLIAEREMILWYSSTERPDLGGREDDDNYFVMEDLVDPELNFPGSYNTVCVEYELDFLPMNAILQSTFINEAEGSDGYAGLSNSDMSSIDEHMNKKSAASGKDSNVIDSNAPSFHAFRALKDLVKGWAKEYHIHDNPLANVMLKNFYRWISTVNSNMHDPSLYAYLHGLMKKNLLLLLADFRRLGAKVVYANFNKIVIVTTKTCFANAKAYSDFVLKTIKDKEMFLWVGLRPVNFWEQLLWMDSMNYGGISAIHDENDLDIQMVPGTPRNIVDRQISIDMCWNINRFLPPFLQKYFTMIIGEFIMKLRQLKVDRRNGATPGRTPARGIPAGMSLTQVRDMDPIVESEKQLVREYFTRKLLAITPEIQKTLSGVIETDEERLNLSFPQLPGSHLNLNNPALELVKYISHLFSLCKEVENEVRIMRRALLQLIGVKEFSPEAEFINPCQSFILPHIICTYCHFCRDMDLARDADLIPESGAAGQPAAWQCPQCNHEYDKSMIEEALVHLVQKSLLAYQLQDLRCAKCRITKVENLREHCKICAGKYKLVGAHAFVHDRGGRTLTDGASIGLTAQELARKLRILKTVADLNQMSFLREVLDWTLSHC